MPARTTAAQGRLLLGLIGSGIQASRTPRMHEREAAAHGLTCLYQLIDLDAPSRGPESLAGLLTAAELVGFAGVNITHPCKQAVLPLLTDLSDDARALGAVNTVVFDRGRRCGHNTDWLGFSAGFRNGLADVRTAEVVQFGCGGAGSATAYAMLRMGAGRLTLVDVDAARAEALAAHFGAIFGPDRIAASTDAAESVARADGIVQASPVGMLSHPGLPFPAEWLRPEMWVAEIVYFPLETELLRAARAAGCRSLDGSGMAVHQAVEAFSLFTGLEPDPARMLRHFLNIHA